MKTSLTVRLDKRRKKNGGEYPLVLAIGHKRSGTSIALGYDIPEKDCDSKKREVKTSYKGTNSVVALNNLLISKRAIDKESIMRIINLELDPDSKLNLNQDIFTASFCMMGMNYADLCLLKVKDIVGGIIKYQREKTDQEFNVKVNGRLQIILNKYIKGKGRNDYIFPIVKRTSPVDIYKDIEWARGRQNKRLKELAKLAKVDENSTTYVARYSFATIAKNQGIPRAALPIIVLTSTTV
ncbi:MAG: hypothetical protein ACI81Y_000845 [Glaciecola sp.]|jgi:hypothetical protein